ncbi:MAG: hypothetical protein M3452_09340 [Chloroflexota bacterium]|nr:hypothetical protein [Chloroflexota bacterium]
MEILVLLITVITLIAVFEVAAIRFGTDSREGPGDSTHMRSGGGSF